MTIEEATRILETFKAKAGDRKDLLDSFGPMKMPGRNIYTEYLYDGPDGEAQKIASCTIQGNGSGAEVIINIGWNEYKFIENPEHAIEIITRFVHAPKTTAICM